MLRAAALLVLLATLVLPVAPVRAAMSATQAEAVILDLVNQARRDRGLVPLARMYDLAVIAGRRASKMASTNVLSHTIAGSVGTALSSRGVRWYRYGEVIAYTGASWTYDAAVSLFRQWRGSSSHWNLLMSARFNYAGVGMAYRSSNRRTFGSIVLSESPDVTGARAWFTGTGRSGTTVRWTWSGADHRLQLHTAGLRDFDVQYRIGLGTWRTLRNDTTGTSLTLSGRIRGRNHYLRVRATDRRGNVGAWTPAMKIYVP